jgi:hypothetical protein
MYRTDLRAACALSLFLVALTAATPATAIITSNTGLNVNNLLGANRFYDAGFDGTGAIIAHIEGGIPWNGHATLSHVVPTPELIGTGALGGIRPGSPSRW